jgi:hypothetical protein
MKDIYSRFVGVVIVIVSLFLLFPTGKAFAWTHENNNFENDPDAYYSVPQKLDRLIR